MKNPNRMHGSMLKDPKRLLTPKEAAEILLVTASNLAQWRYFGMGPPYYRLGESKNARVRYRAHEVEDWLAAQRVEPGRKLKCQRAIGLPHENLDWR